MNKAIKTSASILLMLCLALAVGTLPSRAADATRMIKIGHVNGGDPKDHYHYFCLKANEHLKRISNGKLQFDIYSDSLYGNETELWSGHLTGSIQASISSLSTIAANIDAVKIFDLPFFFDKEAEYLHLWDTPEFSASIIKEIETKWNAHPLASILDASFRNVMTKSRKIESLADMKDLKIRVTHNNIHEAAHSAMGDIPAVIAWGETYTALQQGVIDAIDTQVPISYVMGFYEGGKYFAIINTYPILGIPLINMDLWKSLSAEEQGWLTEACVLACTDQRANQLARLEELTAFLKEKREFVFTYPDRAEFKASVQGVHDRFRDEIGAEKMKIAQQVVADYRAKNK